MTLKLSLIIGLAITCIGLQALINHIYQIRIFKLLVSWLSHTFELDRGLVFGINLCLILTAICLVFGLSRFVQDGYNKITQKPMELIYLGHHSEIAQTFVNPKTGEYFKSLSNYEPPNLSFTSLGKIKLHVKTFSQDYSDSLQTLSLPNLFFRGLFYVWLLTVFLAFFHSAAVNAITLDFPAHPLANKKYLDALDYVLAPFSLNRYHALIVVFGTLFVLLPAEELYNKWQSKQEARYAFQLSTKIKPNQLVNGELVYASAIYRRNHNDDKKVLHIDTGVRIVIVKFNKLYPYPVYVSLKYHESAHPQVTLSELKRKAAANENIQLKIQPDYSLALVDEDFS